MSLSRVLSLLSVGLIGWGLVALQPAIAMENDLPYELQQRLEEPLQERVKALLKERNEENNKLFTGFKERIDKAGEALSKF